MTKECHISGYWEIVQAFCGWLYGQFPPGLLANFKLAGSHLLSMFRAHAAAYKAIKELPGTLQLCQPEGTVASLDFLATRGRRATTDSLMVFLMTA